MSNLINYTLTMRIKDDESWPQNDEYSNRSVSGTFLLDDANPARQVLDIGRCGGEVRIEARYLFQRAAVGGVTIAGDLKLYEGTSTSSNDLDGHVTFTGTAAADGTVTLARRVSNTDEGGDWADVTLTVRNSALTAADPCAHIDAKAAALGVGFTGDAVSGCETVRGGHRKRFQNCDIYYSANTGACEVHGEIRNKYNATGGPDSDQGLPVTDETATPDGAGRYNHFSGNGSIYWHPQTGPMIVRGGIRHSWASQGWERGGLGYPVSDEKYIGTTKPQWFSDFQNGVLFWEENAARPPAAAQLSRARLLTAFDTAFRKRVTDHRVDIQSVAIVGVSATGYDFWRSRNRAVTFRIAGEISTGRWFIPDPNWWLEIPLRIEAAPNPDAATTVKVRVVRAGTVRIHADNFAGIGTGETVDGLRQAITTAFANPIELAEVPAAAGLLSVKVLPDGAVALYFRPDLVGGFAASAAQRQLDNLAI
ncbi:MAG: hypothetical protein Q4G49_17905 [Paracoccus sp. (in: a-proteobacteria)]|nr:hypothetical protein [Paracoccus sp. (in: a-proteobacteria)]